jgi:xanthine dehydrogenase molybdenum-binding subunit
MSLQGPPYNLVGKWKGRRLDSQKKISGQMPYGADWNIPNMAYMKTLHSTIPSGTITSMDASAALAMPGVLGVITTTDVANNPAWKAVMLEGLYPLLPYDKIRVGGEEIAAVAAEDPFIAEEACQAIKVTYQPAPFVLHPEYAAKTSAPQVYTGSPNIIGNPTVYDFGDTTTAMNASGVQIISGRYETQKLQHNNILTQAFTVSYDGTGRVEMWTSSQGPKAMQWSLAQALGVASSRVRVINYACDGGFGDKGGPLIAFRGHILGALLSQKTGRPIHYRYSREDNYVECLHSSKIIAYIDTAVKSDGTITALKATVYNDASAYGCSAAGADSAASLLYAVYKFPNFNITAIDVYDNNWKVGPYRCPSAKQGAWFLNSHMDKVAAKLGMSPVDLMAKNNMYVSGDSDQQTGMGILSCGQPAILNSALQMSNFKQKWKPNPVPSTLTGVVHGIGIANTSVGNGAFALPQVCFVEMQPDGGFGLHVQPQELGQGNREEKTIIAAEALGLPFSMVTLNDYESDAGADCSIGATVGSITTKGSGNAIGLACLDAKRQLLAKAAATLNTTADKLTYALDGSMKIFVTADPTQSVTFASLWGDPIIEGVGTTTGILFSKVGQVYDTCVAEVDVDTDTGAVTVTDVYLSQDVGRLIFPAGAEAQAQGAITQGIGFALQEEMWPDIPTGLPYTFGHLDLKMINSTQYPTNVQVSYIENPEPAPFSYNFGAKGMGEPWLPPVVAAVANAVSNAIGVYIDYLPLTHDKVLAALGKATWSNSAPPNQPPPGSG